MLEKTIIEIEDIDDKEEEGIQLPPEIEDSIFIEEISEIIDEEIDNTDEVPKKFNVTGNCSGVYKSGNSKTTFYNNLNNAHSISTI